MKYLVVRPNICDVACSVHEDRLAEYCNRELTIFMCASCLRDNLAEVGIFLPDNFANLR